MKYDTIIFDLDGTLLDTLEDLCDSTNFSLLSQGLPTRSIDEIRSFVGNGIANLISRAIPEGTDLECEQRVFLAFKEHYRDNSNIKTAPYPGIISLLKKLKEENVKTAIVSNKADFAVQTLTELYFPSLIDTAVGELSGVARKPAPDTTFIAMERLGAQNALYVGDSQVDVATAAAAGLDGVFVSWGFRSEEQLREAGAHIIVHNTEELYERMK